MTKLRPSSSTEHALQLPAPRSGQSRERSAIIEWRRLLGHDRVSLAEDDIEAHTCDTSGERNRSCGLLRPREAAEVQRIVEIAHRHRESLYPISTGHNWGYGTANPAAANCWLLDLSELNEVSWIDRELGLVSVEPGVTQQQLYDFLRSESSDYMVPVHGGGPTCSLLGNALERGYGLTPTCDHFLALTSLDAVLADGTAYCSPLSELANPQLQGYRWGIGPYLDGLFSQGNFGVVTRATIALEKRPEHVEAFFVRVPDETAFCAAIEGLRELAHSLPGSFVGANMMNARRVLSMSIPYPFDQAESEGILSQETIDQLAKAGGVTAWTIAGIVHCPTSLRRSLRKHVKRCLAPVGQRLTFMNRRRLDLVRRLKFLPVPNRRLLLQQIESIQSLLNVATGEPSRVALPLAYWLKRHPSYAESTGGGDPAKDQCGLIWYSPLVPAQCELVKAFSQMVERVCEEHQIEPLVTLTTVSARMYDATVPLLFDPAEPGAAQRAQSCYEQLLAEGEQLGVFPYRVGLSAQRELAQSEKFGSWCIADRLRRSLDPFGTIAPGRYSADPRDF